MRVNKGWRDLGWRHPLWDYVRFYTSLRKNEKYHSVWLAKLKEGIFEVQPGVTLAVPPDDMRLFLKYLDEREASYGDAASKLRTKEEALAYCEELKADVTMTRTKLRDWQDSPKAMVAAVTNIAKLVCQERSVGFVPTPQRRGVWLVENDLHVSARNLDGAIPSLFRPEILWEIKEYWGGGEGKDGGSKMSDAVYECNLVGRELREFEDRTGQPRIAHIVFLDGKNQWGARASDLKRFLDLFHQGIIDQLLIGREVETDWQSTLNGLLSGANKSS
jgi:hypothetical protein